MVGEPVGGVVTDVGGSVGGFVSGTGTRVVASKDGADVGAIGASVVTGVSAVGEIDGEIGAIVGDPVGSPVGDNVEPKGQSWGTGGTNRVYRNVVRVVLINTRWKISSEKSLTKEVQPALWPSIKTGYALQSLLNVIM